MDNESQVAVYHPYIDITDGGLIKTAALYWDEIQTIVPFSINDPYCSRASREACSMGLLQPKIVNSFDDCVNKTGEEFLNDLESRPLCSNLAKFVTSPVITKRISKHENRFSIYKEKWSPLYLDKICWKLRERFELNAIDDRVILPEAVALAYMSRLASVISEIDSSTPITDVTNYHNIVIDRYVDQGNQEQDNLSELAKLSLNTIRIGQEVPLVAVLHFRDKHRTELSSFRKAIRRLTRQVGTGLNTSKRQQRF